MYYLYILKSKNSERYYIGETNNIENRIKQHKCGRTVFGRRNANLVLAYKQEFNNRGEAKRLESFLKKQKSHRFIDRFITGKIVIPR